VVLKINVPPYLPFSFREDLTGFFEGHPVKKRKRRQKNKNQYFFIKDFLPINRCYFTTETEKNKHLFLSLRA